MTERDKQNELAAYHLNLPAAMAINWRNIMIEPIKEMERIVTQISRNYAPLKIILFGSLANGYAAEAHDIDLLVIKDTDKNPWQRTREVSSLFEHSSPIDLLVYTPEEIKERVDMNDFFILDILEHGKVVYERGI